MRWKMIVGLLIFIMGGGCDPYQKGMNMLERGEYEEAAEYFSRQVNKHPDDPRAHNQLGFAYSRLRMYGAAAVEYKKAVELDPEYFEARLNLGTADLMTLNLFGAEEQLLKALELNPDSEAGHVNLAWTYHHMTKFDKAWEHLNRAIELSGGARDYAKMAAMIKDKESRYRKPEKTEEAPGAPAEEPPAEKEEGARKEGEAGAK